MTDIALFHSALGVRPGITAAAAGLEAAGHQVLVIDQYGGRVFDDYGEGARFAAQIGFPELMHRAAEAVRQLPGPFIAAGFSNGAGMAEYVATQRACAGVLLLSGAVPIAVLGSTGWPTGVPAQVHYMAADPFRNQEWLDALARDIRAAGAPVEIFDYPGTGHLFTDPSLPAEYDEQATSLLWERALAFCKKRW